MRGARGVGAHLTLFRMTGVMLDRNAEFIPPDRQIAQPERNKFRVPENVRCARGVGVVSEIGKESTFPRKRSSGERVVADGHSLSPS
jgi:hypothetical protein